MGEHDPPAIYRCAGDMPGGVSALRARYRSGDLAEKRRVDIGAQQIDGTDDEDGEEAGNHGVLDRRCAACIGEK